MKNIAKSLSMLLLVVVPQLVSAQKNSDPEGFITYSLPSTTITLDVEAVQEKMLYGYHDVHGNPPHTEIVDTGRLFDSIDAQFKRVSQNAYSVDVGGYTPYARYVHEGTPTLKGRPFIRDAVMDSQEKLKTILSENLKNGMK